MSDDEGGQGPHRSGADETGHTPQDYIQRIESLQDEIIRMRVSLENEMASRRPDTTTTPPAENVHAVWGNWNPTALPKYDGTLTVDLLAWQDAMETFMQLKRVPKDLWGTFAKFAISKDALTWYYNLGRGNGDVDPTWDLVTTEFQNRALSRVRVNDMRRRIQVLTYTGDTTSYARRVFR